MNNWKPINPEITPNLNWCSSPNYHFAALDTLAPLVFDELAIASKDMVAVFVPGPDDQFNLMALQSLQPGLNVYVDSAGQWRGSHLPRFYRGLPFGLVPAEEDRISMFYDEDSPLFKESAGPLNAWLYNEAGEFSEDFQWQLDFHRNYHPQKERTQALVNQLAAYGLIQPWTLELDLFQDNKPLKIEGLYRIHSKDLQALDAEALLPLNTSGALQLAYTHLNSFARFKDLSRLYAQNDQVRQELLERQAALGKAQVDIDSLEDLDDELFKF